MKAFILASACAAALATASPCFAAAHPAPGSLLLCSFPEKYGYTPQLYVRFSGRRVRTKYADAEASGWSPITSMDADAILVLNYLPHRRGRSLGAFTVGSRQIRAAMGDLGRPCELGSSAACRNLSCRDSTEPEQQGASARIS
ncbi:MAG TPA: hypothetical protein VFE60_25835 [Roseiarcus sp.]|nr:hypothetical protein [Roseiarcus sp.]